MWKTEGLKQALDKWNFDAAFGGAALAQAFRRHRRVAAAGTGTVGAVFLGFSVKLATATLG